LSPLLFTTEVKAPGSAKNNFLCSMSLVTASLNSGSNGNCYYIGNANDAVLIDAGISCRETERRLQQLNLSMHLVKAIFISHEHSDHIKGVAVLANKYAIPVYITDKTNRYCQGIRNELCKPFIPLSPVQIGSLSVTAFSKFHDAADPHSFLISSEGVNIGVFTDIGKVCKEVIHFFKQCHAAYLETNYDVEMLETGSYPLHLKKRITGGRGHLSNHQALELFKLHRPPYMTHVFLSHLSHENNNPETAVRIFQGFCSQTQFIVASRYAPTAVYAIHSINKAILKLPAGPAPKPKQLLLFE
jgi:phosphoribosyl 1,2-cyclic phosphodiesterase